MQINANVLLTKLFFSLFQKIDEGISSQSLYDDSFFLHRIYLIIYFSQCFSYIVQNYLPFNDEKMAFFFNFIYYSNFAQIILRTNSDYLILFAYFSMSFALLFFLFFVFFSGNRNKLGKSLMNSLFLLFFQSFFWIFFIPFTEILLFPLKCLSNEFSEDFSLCSADFQPLFLFISVFSWTIAIIFVFLYLFVFSDYNFLSLNRMSMDLDVYSVLCSLIRAILPIISMYFGETSVTVHYILVYFFIFLSFIGYFRRFPFRYSPLSRFYLSLLLVFLFLAVQKSLNDYDIFITDYDFVFLFAILSVFYCKFAALLFEKIYYFLVLQGNPSEISYFLYNMEEMLRLQLKQEYIEESKFLLFGLLKTHKKHCLFDKCKFSKEKPTKFYELDRQSLIKVKLIGSIQKHFYDKILENTKKHRTNDVLLTKYLTFLCRFNFKLSNTYYKVQKISLFLPEKSFVIRLWFRLILKKLQFRMIALQQDYSLSSEDSVITTSSFRSFTKTKQKLEEQAKSLFKSRLSFWENYEAIRADFSSDGMIPSINREISLLKSFESLTLEKKGDNHEEKLLKLKFSIICKSLLKNSLHEALKLEESLINYKKKLFHNKQIFSNLSIFNEDFVICQASFIQNKGTLLDSSKTEKIAAFFGYEPHEKTLLTSVEGVMPAEIAKIHQQMVEFNLYKSERNFIKQQIVTYAKNKQNFLFPIKARLGYSLYLEDFIIFAAVFKENEAAPGVCFNNEGEVLGISEEFFRIFQEKYQGISAEDFEFLNIFAMIEKLKEIADKIEENQWKDGHIFRNIEDELIYPENLMDIIQFMRLKRQDLGNNLANCQKNNETFSFNTKKSIVSNRSDTKNFRAKTFSMNFDKKFNKNASFMEKKEKLLTYCDNNQAFPNIADNQLIFNELFEEKNMESRKILFDIRIKRHRYGTKPTESLNLCWLKVNKLHKLKRKRENCFKIRMSKTNAVNFDENVEESEISFLEEKLPMNFNETPMKNQVFEQNLIENEDFIKKKTLKNKSNQPIVKEIVNENEKEFEKASKTAKEDENSAINFSENADETKENARKPANLDANSQNSSISSTKTNFFIFENMKKIQETFPFTQKLAIILIFSELLLIGLFTLVVYLSTNSYVNDEYTPLQDLSISQCKANVAVDISALILGEFEYSLYNFSKLSTFQTNELQRILTRNYIIAKNLSDKDRKTSQNSFLSIEQFNKQYFPYILQRNSTKVEKLLMRDINDDILGLLHGLVEKGLFYKENVKILARNFPYYAILSRSYREAIQKEFVDTNYKTTEQIVKLMVVFMIIMSAIKLSQIYINHLFYSKLIFLTKIFFRTSQKDAENEQIFIKQALEALEDPKHNYFHYNFPAIVQNQREYYRAEQAEAKRSSLLVKNPKKPRKKLVKKKSFLMRKGMFVLQISTLLLSFGLFFGTYLFWLSTNENINKLIDITLMFNELYVMTTTTQNYQCLNFREKVIRDPEYEKSMEYYQIHVNRLEYFEEKFQDRLEKLSNYVGKLPDFAFQAPSFMDDPMFSQLVKANVCEILLDFLVIEQEHLEFCQGVYSSSLLKGVFSGMIELTQFLINKQDLVITINNSDLTATKKQMSQIYYYLNKPLHTEGVIGNYYLSESLLIFYNYLSTFYMQELNATVFNMNNFLGVFCVLDILAMFLISFLMWRAAIKVYENLTYSLAIIPHERITKDEQILFLIKKFLKEKYSLR